MSVTHYVSDSRGPVEIAGMNYHHAENAAAKLAREQFIGERHPRQGELDAINAHIATLEAEQEAEAQVND